ncbi:MAG: cell division protein FtsZ [Elusimicrobiales bacterium]|nr:cell division protein FtsZ [Elusimicrobiales bacterium]
MVRLVCVDDFKGKEARIKVIGVGGGGGNAVHRMVEADIREVEFVALNTDAQALKRNPAPVRIQIGEDITKGLGVGGDPEKGRQAALESAEQIREIVSGCDLIFVTAGMGGGTGTGASPIVAKIAKETTTALVVGVVTRPFDFEGNVRAEQAQKGITEMRKYADSMLIIPNDRVLNMADKDTDTTEAYKMVDDVLRQAIQGISDVVTNAGIVNVDFADVKKVMTKSGEALIGIGMAEGPDKHIEAARKAIESPLLENAIIDGAKGILAIFTSSRNFSIHDLNASMEFIKHSISPDATIKYGQTEDENLGDILKITVIATGFPTKRNFKKELFAAKHARRKEDRLRDWDDLNVHPSGVSTVPDNIEDLEKPAYLRIKRGCKLK